MFAKMVDVRENALGISWHDSAWIPILNPSNIMDYFSERTNPFYDYRTCNNEIVKMQRLSPEQLNNMTGMEYILLHVQEPILYVVRKQHRHSPTQVTPLSDYYIIAGVVYQAPDLGSVVNSRLLSTTHHLQTAFEEAQSYSRYHPSKGYWWEFKDHDPTDTKKKSKDGIKSELSSVFQRQRVDVLLAELSKKYPPKIIQPAQPEKPPPVEDVKPLIEPKVEIKTERVDPPIPVSSPSTPAIQAPVKVNPAKPPLEKRPRLMWVNSIAPTQ